MQEDYRKWMIEKLKDKFRFELISMFSFGETVWEAATKAAVEKFTASNNASTPCRWYKNGCETCTCNPPAQAHVA